MKSISPKPEDKNPSAPNTKYPKLASVDYRLKRAALLKDYKEGRIFRSEICEPHPDLVRVAKGVGEPCGIRCPVCRKKELVHLKYVYGPRLGPSGRCIYQPKDMDDIKSRKGIFTCFVVEVCTGCSWNHLVKSYPVEGRPSAK